MVQTTNNLWVLIAALLVFTMTISVGFLEIGELGEGLHFSLLKTILITGLALVVMAIIGFNTAFAPTVGGVIGRPFYSPGFFLGGFSGSGLSGTSSVWWSMRPGFFNTGLTPATYFLFETAFAAVTLALVALVVLRKMKLKAFVCYSVVYFVLIWNLPAAWIWNPTGWLARRGMVDFAGGLVVHGAAGAAGLAVVLQLWREERRLGIRTSPQPEFNISPGWLTLAVLLLWVGWFGFNPGSVLVFNNEAMIVVITTFLAAASCLCSTMFCAYVLSTHEPELQTLYAVNGVIMGLIVITPLGRFVSPASAIILGLCGGPLFLAGERLFGRFSWFADPAGLFPAHMVGGLFGVVMIAFFSQRRFAAGSGFPKLPNGLFFGGGEPCRSSARRRAARHRHRHGRRLRPLIFDSRDPRTIVRRNPQSAGRAARACSRSHRIRLTLHQMPASASMVKKSSMPGRSECGGCSMPLISPLHDI